MIYDIYTGWDFLPYKILDLKRVAAVVYTYILASLNDARDE